MRHLLLNPGTDIVSPGDERLSWITHKFHRLQEGSSPIGHPVQPGEVYRRPMPARSLLRIAAEALQSVIDKPETL